MKKLQNGRSMIEMLGVLAIIGVLSIGGLAGYSMAMNRHKANQILDYVTKAGVAALTFGQNGTGTTAETACSVLLDGEVISASLLTNCTVNGRVVTVAYPATSDVDDVIIERIVNGTIGGIAVNANATQFTF